MAKIQINKLLETIRGRVSKMYIRQRPDGTLILSGVPRYKKRSGSPKQKAHRQRVKYAAKAAKQLAKIHPNYAELARSEVARGRWLSDYNFAFADCLKPPVIHRIERVEGCIRVEATDNVMVMGVQVTVLDETGRILEMGEAIRAEGDWWEFASHLEGKTILAEAWDLPYNCISLEMREPLPTPLPKHKEIV